jgi:hypothetical protein
MIIDGHFHFHYRLPQKYSNKIIRQLPTIENLREIYLLDTILSIVPSRNSEIVEKLRDYTYLYPGIYIFIEEYEETSLEKIRNFNFIKIHHWLGMPYLLKDKLKKLFQDAISIGKRKFQIHTTRIDEGDLELMESYIKNTMQCFILLMASMRSLIAK